MVPGWGHGDADAGGVGRVDGAAGGGHDGGHLHSCPQSASFCSESAVEVK